MEVNRQSWDVRVPVHEASRFYDVEGFRAGRQTIRTPDIEWIGDPRGKSVLHLMCHFGLDTMSLSRLGARATGVDFSSAAVARARALASELGLDTRFVEANVLDVDLGEQFNLVYTSWGILTWLPDLTAWAATVRRHLAPDGRFLMFEFHPQSNVFGPDLTFDYPYFDPESVREVHGTYTDAPDDFQIETEEWQHTMSAVISALLGAGLTLTRFEEFDFSRWKRFAAMREDSPGRWRLPKPWFPLSFGLEAKAITGASGRRGPSVSPRRSLDGGLVR